MRIVRFLYKRKVSWGVAEGDLIAVLSQPPFSRIVSSGRKIPLSAVRLLPPADPSKIILVGLNYRRHAAEMGMAVPGHPIIFMKPPTSLLPPGGSIIYPPGVGRLDFEAELALVIKKTAKGVSAGRAPGHILGYTCLNDVTARDLQKLDGQWTRAKSFDTFCPLGPWVETRYEPAGKRVRSFLNGGIRQDSSTADFIFSPASIVAFVSSVMTLYPGDVISTGTPEGVGPMRAGDRVAVEIEGLGRLENTVEKFPRRQPRAGRR